MVLYDPLSSSFSFSLKVEFLLLPLARRSLHMIPLMRSDSLDHSATRSIKAKVLANQCSVVI